MLSSQSENFVVENKMKAYAIISLLLRVLCERVNGDTNHPIMSSALENITNHLFTLEAKMFINNFGLDLTALTQLILKNLNEQVMPYQLQNQRLTSEDSELMLNSSAFLTFSSFENVRVFNDKLVLGNEYYKPLQLFVFCQGASVSDVESLAADVILRAKNNPRFIRYARMEEPGRWVKDWAGFNTQLADNIQYEYFLVNEANVIKLMTFVFYSSVKCGQLQLIEVNRFSKITAKWENSRFSIEKLANLFECELVFHEDPAYAGSHFHSYLPYMLQTSLNYTLTEYLDRRNNNDLVDIYSSKGCFNAFDNHQKIQDMSTKR